MVTADYIAIITVVAAGLLGAISGFGKTLKFFTSGIFGKIVSVIICYFIFGLVYNIPFVQELLQKFITFLTEKNNFFCNLLIKIRVDIIVFAIVLFVVVQILISIVVAIINGVSSKDNAVIKFVDMVLGIAFFIAIIIVFVLVAFQITFWIDGADGQFIGLLKGSKFGLEDFYLHNPLLELKNLIASKA